MYLNIYFLYGLYIKEIYYKEFSSKISKFINYLLANSIKLFIIVKCNRQFGLEILVLRSYERMKIRLLAAIVSHTIDYKNITRF